MKKLFLIINLLLICSSPSLAADQTADSCSAADIQTAIDDCVSTGGGKVTIPACSGGANGSTWTNGNCVCIASQTNPLIVKGSGQTTTYIKYADGANSPASCAICPVWTSNPPVTGGKTTMFTVFGAGVQEVSDFTISGSDDLGSLIFGVSGCSSNITNLRVHHMSFRKISGGGGVLNMLKHGQVILYDHLFIGDKVDTWAYGMETITDGNNETYWVDPITTLGTNDGVFVEDSVFDGLYHGIDAFGATHYTVRYNTFRNTNGAPIRGHGPSYSFTFSGCSNYGTQQNCYQGTYAMEVYNNTFESTTGSALYGAAGYYIATDNTVTSSQYQPIVTVSEGAGIGSDCTPPTCPTAYGWGGTGSCNSAGNQGCWQLIRAFYAWNNDITSTNPTCSKTNNTSCRTTEGNQGCIRVGTEVFLDRGPQAGDPLITSYTKYTYPHPLQGGIPPSIRGLIIQGGQIQ